MNESNFFKNITSLDNRTVEQRANFEGDWTGLLKDRLLDPEIKKQFIAKRQQYIDSLSPDYASMMPYATGELATQIQDAQKILIKDYYQQQIDNYEKNIEHVFSGTDIVIKKEPWMNAADLGRNEYGKQGTMVLDAKREKSDGFTEIDVSKLNNHQKNIFESHEKGHGVRDYRAQDVPEILATLDMKDFPMNGIKQYFSDPIEIIERMSQLKNYFQFKGDEKFTHEHLEYARQNYIHDTGLDNEMTWFFKGITPETEKQFLEVMNTYGI